MTSSTNEVITVDYRITSIELNELKPYTKYNVSVAASTIAGEGPNNFPAVQFRTNESGKLFKLIFFLLKCTFMITIC